VVVDLVRWSPDTHKQMLMRLEAGGLLFIQLGFSTFVVVIVGFKHLQSTLQAVAHRARGRCIVISCHHVVLVLVPAYPLFLVIRCWSSSWWEISTTHPPCKQVLTGMEGGPCSAVSVGPVIVG
jgi:hypothetical protein